MASILRTFSRPLLQRCIHNTFAPRFHRLLSDYHCKPQESLPTSQQLQVRASTSLAWVQLYSKCPASFGVGTFSGYHEMISPNSVLPIKKKDILVNALPYVRESDFPVYYRRTPRDVPVLIESINLQGLTLGETEKVHYRVTMGLGQNLIGHLKVEDIKNGKVVTMDFDGTAAAHPQREQDHCCLS